MKNKLKSKAFWLSASGALLLLLQTIGFRVDVPYVNEVVSAACAFLVILGVMTDDAKQESAVVKTDGVNEKSEPSFDLQEEKYHATENEEFAETDCEDSLQKEEDGVEISTSELEEESRSEEETEQTVPAKTVDEGKRTDNEET